MNTRLCPIYLAPLAVLVLGSCQSSPLDSNLKDTPLSEQPADLTYRPEPDDGFVRYPETEVIRFPSQGVDLEGILDLPGFHGQYPLMLFVHGSGPTTRAHYQSYTERYRPIGYATFRYDKRGVGASGGTYSGVSPANSDALLRLLGQDANAAVQALKTHPNVDSNQIILIGGSQAGWIIPVAANLSQSVALCILMVGPTVSVGEEIYYSSLTRTSLSDSAISAQLAAWNGLRGYDPVPFIEQMDMPAIWLLGGKDRSIPTKESIEILEHIIGRDNKPFTIDLYPTGTHALRDATTGEALPFHRSIKSWLWEQRQRLNDRGSDAWLVQDQHTTH